MTPRQLQRAVEDLIEASGYTLEKVNVDFNGATNVFDPWTGPVGWESLKITVDCNRRRPQPAPGA